MPFKSYNKNLRVSFGDDSPISVDDLSSLQFDDAPIDHVDLNNCGYNSDTGMDIYKKSKTFPKANSSCETIASSSGVSSTSYDFLADQSNGVGGTSFSSSSKVLTESFCLEKHDFPTPNSFLSSLENLSNQLDPKNSLEEDGTSLDCEEPDSLNKYSSSSMSKVISDFPLESYTFE